MYRPLPKLFLAALAALGLNLAVASSARAADAETVDAETVPAVPEAPLSTAAPAGESPLSTPPQPDPAVIQRLRNRGLKITAGGIVGGELRFWLVYPRPGESSRRVTLILTTPKGHLIQGKAYAADGSILIDTEASKLYINEANRRRDGYPDLVDQRSLKTSSLKTTNAPLPATSSGSLPPGGGLWDHLGQATVIEEGKAGAPLVYIFIDPYCPYCHQQWSLLREKVRQGKLRVRWVPVAVLSGSQGNLGVVQGLLREPSAETLAGWMRQRRVAPDDSEATKVALGRNMALFQALKVSSVPVLLYKDKTGKLVTKVGLTDL